MSKGEETRAAILDEAVAEASRFGLEALTIGQLAQRVGLSKSGLFAHFGSKEDLQLQVLESAVARFVERVVAPGLRAARGVPRVRSLFEHWLAWEQDAALLPGGCVFITLANELDDRPGPLRDRLVGYQRDWIEALATAARIAVEEGHFRAGLDTAQFAHDFYSVFLAYHHFNRLLREPRAEERARRAFDHLVAAAAGPDVPDPEPPAHPAP
ncbi:MAG TPA: TetR/AcrR family transcriptional regulator [Thermoanaerobaculia bacterium]|nr:TetR/AcrR family transcriptional regulator [Thermoanaerobaculia bacterium]